MTKPEQASALPAHINEIVQEMARLHGRHHEKVSPLQRVVERLTALFVQPVSICLLFLAVTAWLVVNGMQAAFGGRLAAGRWTLPPLYG